MNPVIRITGEGRAEFLRTWGAGLIKKGGGAGGTGGAARFVCGNYKSYPVSRTTSEERAERSRGIYVGVCYTNTINLLLL